MRADEPDDPAAGWEEGWPTDDDWPDDWPDDRAYSVDYAKELISKIMWADYAEKIRAELDNDLGRK